MEKNIEELQKEIESLKRQIEKKDKESKLTSLIDQETLLQMNDFNDIANENMSYCTVDKNLNVKQVSKSFSELLGYTNSTLNGKSFNLLVSAEYAEKFYNGCEYVKNHGRESWGTEIALASVDDKEIFTKTIINPYFVNNQLDGFIFVIHDVSNERLLHKLQVKMLSQEKFH